MSGRTTVGTALLLGAALAGLAACGKAGAPAATTAASGATSASAAATAAPAQGTDAADVKAFLEGVYAHYKSPAEKDHTFAPMDRDVKAVFDKAMVDLLAKDAKLNGPDEVGAIDGDWICACQDYDSITATVAVQSATASAAKATVDFHVFQEKHHNVFDLVKENGAWRVHDVQEVAPGKSLPSLRKTLEDDIAQFQKAGKKKTSPDEAP